MNPGLPADHSQPLYESGPSMRSLGNAYRIYADRLEISFGWFFLKRKWVIAKDDLISIDTYPPPVIRTALWALKIDWADLYPHVGIRRRSGFFKQVRFTPHAPDAFVSRAREVFGLDGP